MLWKGIESMLGGQGAGGMTARLRGLRGARERESYLSQLYPNYFTYGPKTRREFLNLQGWTDGVQA